MRGIPSTRICASPRGTGAGFHATHEDRSSVGKFLVNMLADPKSSLSNVLQRYWGYNSFRPLQSEAMHAVLEHRDSVVVLPTGGGKSICFQAPAVAMPGMAVVISPLISLMKDQVDALTEYGIAAACIHDDRNLTTAR